MNSDLAVVLWSNCDVMGVVLRVLCLVIDLDRA
jgi:hypothetical protein